MKKYILTSPRFTGSVTFGYDAKDRLIFYHNESDHDICVEWLMTRIPATTAELQILRGKIDGQIKEVPADLSFDTFWNKYEKKINRKRCEPMWKKLSDASKMQAIMNIKPYDVYLGRTGIGKAHPDNYLSREYYLVDWSKEK